MNYIVVAFFFTDTHTTEIYTLSLHDALPISETFVGLLCKEKKVLLLQSSNTSGSPDGQDNQRSAVNPCRRNTPQNRSEEHTSELQSLRHLVCRLLLEKKKNNKK